MFGYITQSFQLPSSPVQQQQQESNNDLDEQRRRRSWERLITTMRRTIDDVYLECEAECGNMSDYQGTNEMCQEAIDVLTKAISDFEEVCIDVTIINANTMDNIVSKKR
jgi:hypothetical protein